MDEAEDRERPLTWIRRQIRGRVGVGFSRFDALKLGRLHE
jgi:hypothetical protein